MHDGFHWDNDMIESVNWEAFSKAFRSNQKLRVFTFKLCFWLQYATFQEEKQGMNLVFSLSPED